MHWERYHRPTADELDALVAAHDDPEQHLMLTDAWQQQGMDHYLDWFYTAWSVRGGQRKGRSQMSVLIERVGFSETEGE